MIKIYGIPLSNHLNKIRYLLDYLKTPYEVVEVNALKGENQSQEYFNISPTGKIPAVEVDGFKLFESNAILRYLARKQGATLYPADLQKAAVVDAWMDFVAIHVSNALGRVLFNRVMAPMFKRDVDQNSLQFGVEMMGKYLPIIDKQLAANPYIAGKELTIADFSLLGALDPCDIAQIDLSAYKAVVRWRTDLQKQPFYQKASQDQREFVQSLAAGGK